MKKINLVLSSLMALSAYANHKPVVLDVEAHIAGCEACPNGHISCSECAASPEEAILFFKDSDNLGEKRARNTRPHRSDCNYPTENGCPEGFYCAQVTSNYSMCFEE